jgi:hypothetical protein
MPQGLYLAEPQWGFKPHYTNMGRYVQTSSRHYVYRNERITTWMPIKFRQWYRFRAVSYMFKRSYAYKSFRRIDGHAESWTTVDGCLQRLSFEGNRCYVKGKGPDAMCQDRRVDEVKDLWATWGVPVGRPNCEAAPVTLWGKVLAPAEELVSAIPGDDPIADELTPVALLGPSGIGGAEGSLNTTAEVLSGLWQNDGKDVASHAVKAGRDTVKAVTGYAKRTAEDALKSKMTAAKKYVEDKKQELQKVKETVKQLKEDPLKVLGRGQ